MLAIITAGIFCIALPLIFVTALTRILAETAPLYPNYRGVDVYQGLGIVWFFWLLAIWAGAHLLDKTVGGIPNWMSYLLPIFPLISGSCVFGLLADWAGGQNNTGFRDRIASLARGILTIADIKMMGIATLAVFTLVSLYWGSPLAGLRIIAGSLIILLSASFIKLLNRRPGRAAKTYALGLVLSLVAIFLGNVVHLLWPDLVALALAGFGPLLAVWRFDLKEEGLQGDTGANSMGVFLGFLLATALPIWALITLALLLLALNIVGGQIPIDNIIAANRILHKLDQLGRKDVVE